MERASETDHRLDILWLDLDVILNLVIKLVRDACAAVSRRVF